MPADTHLERFAHTKYVIKRQFFKLAGGAFRIYDENDNLLLFSKMKAFRLREDIRIYGDEALSTELLTITTKSIFDVSGTYDIIDAVSGERLGALRRKGIKSSLLRDEWLIVDESGREEGKITEDSQVKALIRRWVDFAAFLMPQAYTATVGGGEVAEFKQRFNPLTMHMDIDFSADAQMLLDRRVGLAAAVLLCAIEGRQG